MKNISLHIKQEEKEEIVFNFDNLEINQRFLHHKINNYDLGPPTIEKIGIVTIITSNVPKPLLEEIDRLIKNYFNQ